MMMTGADEIVLDREDTQRLSKLIEWARQFVISLEHMTVEDAALFVRDWEALTAPAL
jgi:hypothetical protein